MAVSMELTASSISLLEIVASLSLQPRVLLGLAAVPWKLASEALLHDINAQGANPCTGGHCWPVAKCPTVVRRERQLNSISSPVETRARSWRGPTRY